MQGLPNVEGKICIVIFNLSLNLYLKRDGLEATSPGWM